MNQSTERALYRADDLRLQDKQLALASQYGMSEDLYEEILKFSKNLYLYKIEGGKIYKNRRKSNKEDYFNHIRRINVRSLEMGVKNPLHLLSELAHDSVETLISIGERGVLNVPPLQAVDVFEFDLVDNKDLIRALGVNYHDLFKMGLILTRPYKRDNNNKKWIEDKGDISYFQRFMDLEDNKFESFGVKIDPVKYFPLPLFCKVSDKIDNLDYFMSHRARNASKKRQLFESGLLERFLEEIPVPVKSVREGYHNTYTKDYYSEHYIFALRAKLEEKVQGLLEKGRVNKGQYHFDKGIDIAERILGCE